MNSLVLGQTALSCASIIALAAGEQTLTGMYAFVGTEMARVCRSVLTFVAGEWTLARMSSLV